MTLVADGKGILAMPRGMTEAGCRTHTGDSVETTESLTSDRSVLNNKDIVTDPITMLTSYRRCRPHASVSYAITREAHYRCRAQMLAIVQCVIQSMLPSLSNVGITTHFSHSYSSSSRNSTSTTQHGQMGRPMHSSLIGCLTNSPSFNEHASPRSQKLSHHHYHLYPAC